VTAPISAIVLFGDVVDSRRDAGASGYLRALRDELDVAYGAERLALTGFTQGDEIQLLLELGADPFGAVVRAALHPQARELRWAIVAGVVDRGSGPATERNGPAFRTARDLIDRARTRREGMLALTGDPAADALLADLAPLLPALLAELTARQREVGRLLLVENLRRADAAERLRVSRATISVIADRGRIRHLGRLATGLAAIFRDGVSRADAPHGEGPIAAGHPTGSAA
jgi:predicted DNA-binding protein (UPF0251 family)